MMDIFNMLGGMGQTQQQVSRQLGTDPSQTASALEAAVPLLLGALTRNAQSPQGAASLESALNDHTGNTIGLFQQGQVPDQGAAQRMLGHIFGGQQNAAVNAVSQRAGISPQLAMQVLMMVAPLILNYLARQRGSAQSGNMGANAGGIDIGSILGGILGGGGLGNVLGGALGGQQNQSQGYQQSQGSVLGGGSVIPGYPGASNQMSQRSGQMGGGGNLGGMIGTLNNVLDRDGDGNALDDLIGMFGGRRA
ncbi:DUF937 domain-containing protein [Deinococcus fonticola]|uniref:DUF937 domain-containing protein n=1 Tax=Deinococcus fonticola TaxID=2528713 RepID=UPI0010758C5E|nr:DUF937 domain-containing protein [Deinococcus fonticola]